MKKLPAVDSLDILSDRVICPSDGLIYHDFPSIEKALVIPNGLLAIGGHYSMRRLHNAFSQGIFPWTNSSNPNLWWSPNPRCVFEVASWKPSRSLRRLFNQTVGKNDDWQITFNQQHHEVMKGCAERLETWLCEDLMQALLGLHREYGCLFSVEVLHHQQLVGGLYGICMPPMFFAESMFSRVTGASKLALMGLMDYASLYQFSLVDAQIESDHLMMLGAKNIDRQELMEQVSKI